MNTADAQPVQTEPVDGGARETGASGESGASGRSGAGASGGRAPVAGQGGAGMVAVPVGGSGGKADEAGSGGAAGATAGASGAAGAAPAPLPCSTPGALRCATEPGQREQCEGGEWQPAAPCAQGEVCSGLAGSAGSCQMVAAICQGNAGKNVCDGQGGFVACAADGTLQSQQTCMSERHCQLAIATGACPQCIPDEFRCTQASLEQCSDDGQSFGLVKACDSPALCKAEAGECTTKACTAGRFACQGNVLMKCNSDQTAFEMVQTCDPGLCDAANGQCDVCSPNTRSCESASNTALSCDSSGQSLERSPCVAPRSKCAGLGQCVECAADSPCPASSEVCKTASCNVLTGTCGVRNAASGTGCALSGRSGVCDAAGGCVECLNEGDGRCAGATPHCSTARTCVRCTADGHCGLNEKCALNTCRPKCGDGVLDDGEDCEVGFLNSAPSNCNFDTCKRTNYINCSETACSSNTVCLQNFCVPVSDSNCVTSCPVVPGMRSACRSGICYLDCSAAAGGKCPSDMTCTNASPDSAQPTVDMCFGNP